MYKKLTYCVKNSQMALTSHLGLLRAQHFTKRSSFNEQTNKKIAGQK